MEEPQFPVCKQPSPRSPFALLYKNGCHRESTYTFSSHTQRCICEGTDTLIRLCGNHKTKLCIFQILVISTCSLCLQKAQMSSSRYRNFKKLMENKIKRLAYLGKGILWKSLYKRVLSKVPGNVCYEISTQNSKFSSTKKNTCFNSVSHEFLQVLL